MGKPFERDAWTDGSKATMFMMAMRISMSEDLLRRLTATIACITSCLLLVLPPALTTTPTTTTTRAPRTTCTRRRSLHTITPCTERRKVSIQNGHTNRRCVCADMTGKMMDSERCFCFNPIHHRHLHRYHCTSHITITLPPITYVELSA